MHFINVLVYLFLVYALWFYGKSCVNPGVQPAQQCLDTGIAIMQKEERRTGALVLIWSGTVRDDPLVFIKRNACKISFDHT